MKENVFTMGKKEKQIVADWYAEQPVITTHDARILLLIQVALDEINYPYDVESLERLNQLEYVLYMAYNVAIGNYYLDDIINDCCNGGSLIRMVDTSEGLAIVNA